ncbi:MAG: hypothetical protein D6800_01810 [Candidatus Zixiibacteriota bacterium]|nr:MAG: hypothetical protein D6800_01810 [candidate division Zixibacteria bacterium]
MKKHEKDKEAYSRPQKFILHMARRGKEWSGKVQSFDWNEEFQFTTLEALRDWLNRRRTEGEQE